MYYSAAFIRDFRGASTPLHIVAQMVTLIPTGVTAALSLVWIFPRVEGHHIFAISLACFTFGVLMMSVTPAQQNFWAMIFPAQLVVTFGSDFSFGKRRFDEVVVDVS